MIDGAEYRITHPFGVDTHTAEAGAARGINVTEDIGDLAGGSTFEAALGSRPSPFLRWDPAIAPAAPAGYVGDPTVDHQVTGSPYGTNIFRIEGPAGSFTGSPNLCADVRLGDSPTAADDCIETNLFSLMGKYATRAGVQVTKTVTTKDGGGDLVDVFAKSEPGQALVITGTGVAATLMREDGNGAYYGRIRVGGGAPADFAVTNTTDRPTTVDHVDTAQFADKVHVNSAVVRQRHSAAGRHRAVRRPRRGVDPRRLPGGAGHERPGVPVHRVQPGRAAGRGRGDLVEGWQRQ